MAGEMQKEMAERIEAGWRSRAVVATRGNQTLMGAVVQAVIGVAASNPPTLGLTALVDLDGQVRTNMMKRDRKTGAVSAHIGARIGDVIALRDEWRRLADAIKATDVEREEMFDLLRKWMATDLRENLNPETQIGPRGGL